ncbi:mitochondrial inner membrane protein-domain-containing protein [Sporodiniella umbellata]|nr:mitochondrial inner membrane protein-domain-containing protein [Sporodiniella umbellata]
MLRGASRLNVSARSVANSRASARLLTPKRLYSTVEQTAVKGSSLGKKLAWLTIISAASYSGATYFALKNEAFHDTYTTYIPGGEQLLDQLEDWAADDRFKQYYRQASDIKQQVGTHADSAKQLANQTKETAQDWYEYVSDTIAQLRGDKEPPAAPGSGPSPSARRRKFKKETFFANVIHTTENQPIPQFAHSEQEAVNTFAKTVEGLVRVLNDAGMQGYAKRLSDLAIRDIELLDKAFKLIQEEEDKARNEINALEKKLNTVSENIEAHRVQVSERIQEHQTKADDRTQKYVSAVEADISKQTAKVEQEHSDVRAKELAALRQKRLAELETELKNKAIKIQSDYVEQVKKQVETERGGRLSQIELVAAKQIELESLAQADAELLDDNRKAHQLIVAIDALKKAALSGQQTQFELELEAIKKLSNKTPFANLGQRQSDELLQLVASSVQKHVAQYGITSIAQLSERFEVVSREVRRAALIPDEESSMISHLLSIALSGLMFKKKGLVTGDDVESRLARAEHFLHTEKDLENATREVNQLTGWPKRLALDWLDAARRHLEVKQALEVMRSQASLISMLQAK